jgi:hypothetical protein
MLKDLLNQLQTIKKEVDNLDINQLPEDQRVAVVTALADKVLNTLDNAHVEIPEEYQSNSGEQI